MMVRWVPCPPACPGSLRRRALPGCRHGITFNRAFDDPYRTHRSPRGKTPSPGPGQAGGSDGDPGPTHGDWEGRLGSCSEGDPTRVPKVRGHRRAQGTPMSVDPPPGHVDPPGHVGLQDTWDPPPGHVDPPGHIGLQDTWDPPRDTVPQSAGIPPAHTGLQDTWGPQGARSPRAQRTPMAHRPPRCMAPGGAWTPSRACGIPRHMMT